MNEIKVTGQGTLVVGEQCAIGDNVVVIFVQPATVTLGDYVTLGDNVRMVVDGGNVILGDWTSVHNGSLILSKTGVSIGAHCWFGQNTVLDGTGGLTIEGGVRVGMYSQLWSHVAAGEQIEGCTLYGENPIHIESDVWLVGSCMVASGVRIGARTVALAGANVTKSCAPHVVLAGAPAKVREGMSFYRDITLDEKFALLDGWLTSFAAACPTPATVQRDGDALVHVQLHGGDTVAFYKHAAAWQAALDSGVAGTLCCVENKRYRKTLGSAEKAVLKFLSGNKARFYS